MKLMIFVEVIMERKQEDDSRNKRRHILDAAYTVFSKKGYNRATIDEIIKLADTGKGTVYNYFASKEQLFYVLTKERSEPFEQSLRLVFNSSSDPLNKLKEMIRLFLQFYIENADLWRIVMHEMRGVGDKFNSDQCERYGLSFRRTVGMLEKVLAQGIEQRIFRKFDVTKTAYSLFSVIVMMVFQQYVEDMESSAQTIADVFFYGIVEKKE
jgi:AcrR family transcriptional regulator